jgi:hypothetical protein
MDTKTPSQCVSEGVGREEDELNRRNVSPSIRHRETLQQISISQTCACPRCDNTGAHVLRIVGGTLCGCPHCRHLWIDERTLPAPESPFHRRSTDWKEDK